MPAAFQWRLWRPIYRARRASARSRRTLRFASRFARRRAASYRAFRSRRAELLRLRLMSHPASATAAMTAAVSMMTRALAFGRIIAHLRPLGMLA